MELYTQNTALFPTVKCSSCAANIDLASVADHVCQSPVFSRIASEPKSPHDVVISEVHSPMNSHLISTNPFPYEQRSRTPSVRSTRPVLPKLDSSVSGTTDHPNMSLNANNDLGRSGLRPSEAASIAHDLGLPSPGSAGGSSHRVPHRSRSRSRKASLRRPSSPEIPLSQDCAFPPFPAKPKQSQPKKAVKEGHTHKSQSTSRSTSSTKEVHHSPSYSTSSSVYSTASGPGKRRTSNTSSGHRSRQGTMDDSVSWSSTAPSSPRQSSATQSSRKHSIDQVIQLPPLVSSQSNTLSEPASSISPTPPTPSWPLDSIDVPPKILLSPTSEPGWTPTESTIVEERTQDFEKTAQINEGSNNKEEFDQILSSERPRDSIAMFDNPPKEPLYKTKRPTPLLQLPPYTPNVSGMPLSARAPHPPAANNSGLTRTLTSFFGRKRSQSSSSKTMPLPTFDSPRMRALAPDPPERPKRGDSLWDVESPVNDATKILPSTQPRPQEDILQPKDDIVLESHRSTADDFDQHHSHEGRSFNETASFDFPFRSEVLEKGVVPEEASITGKEATAHAVPVVAFVDQGPEQEPEQDQLERDLRRASIDSASSYGSIGFSHRTKSSRSSPPASIEMHQKHPSDSISARSHSDNAELPPPTQLQIHDLIPDSPTDPLYHAGRLSPVAASETVHKMPTADVQQSPLESWPMPRSESLPTVTSEPISRERSREARPQTPAGVKGRCRGCSNLILVGQKSVASADGRLTGRYHKECFVCRTCKGAFATADFYVFEDQAYCAHHYHVLNDTLCTGCGKGIEGQYLETFDVAGSSSKKFHPKCLQCATCKIQLNDDYFEFHGRVYCERDAFRAASGPRHPRDTVPSRPSPLVREYISSGEPGLKGRFPERRTTRLIMT